MEFPAARLLRVAEELPRLVSLRRMARRRPIVRVVHGLDAVGASHDGSVLLIGNFDGVHRGHQQLIAQGALFAAPAAVPLVVLTFEPHPLSILNPTQAPPRLTPLEEKREVLAQLGVAVMVVALTSPELLAIEANRFLEMIVERFRPLHVVEGATFRFGRGRQGTPQLLRDAGERLGFRASIIEPVTLQIDGGRTLPVSSSSIRKHLAEGNVQAAAQCLARPYGLRGTVVRGAGRGAGLGFPTANIGRIEQLVPGDGVYAGSARVGSGKWLAGISIGTNPTFGGSARQVEAHLLDFDGGLDDQSIRLEFGVRLRDQRKFGSADELKRQIALDVQAVRAHAAGSSALPYRRRGDDG